MSVGDNKLPDISNNDKHKDKHIRHTTVVALPPLKLHLRRLLTRVARRNSTAVAGCSKVISLLIARKTADLVGISVWEKFLLKPKQGSH